MRSGDGSSGCVWDGDGRNVQEQERRTNER
jgi:hypothetical protein